MVACLLAEKTMKKLDLAYINKFENLDYEAFKQMAVDSSLLPHEKVGFPDAYRNGKEPLIWQDMLNKLSNLAVPNKWILDIGPGCSDLPRFLSNEAGRLNSRVIFCDSKEMLAQLPDGAGIEKIEGPFPECWQSLQQHRSCLDVIIVYSVFHYVFGRQAQELFFDRCLDLLAGGGQLLLGDLPNYSKRERFFGSTAGKEFHQKYFGSCEMPNLSSKVCEKSKLNDETILTLIKRARRRGFDAYILPQHKDLPMANRREDILILRP
jgi:hypothetical protein